MNGLEGCEEEIGEFVVSDLVNCEVRLIGCLCINWLIVKFMWGR